MAIDQAFLDFVLVIMELAQDIIIKHTYKQLNKEDFDNSKVYFSYLQGV